MSNYVTPEVGKIYDVSWQDCCTDGKFRSRLTAVDVPTGETYKRPIWEGLDEHGRPNGEIARWEEVILTWDYQFENGVIGDGFSFKEIE